jgi:Ulp1 family protease
LQPLVDQVNEQYNQGNSNIDAIIVSERGDSTTSDGIESKSGQYNHGISNTDAIIVHDNASPVPFAETSNSRASIVQNFKLMYKEQTLTSLEQGNWLNDCAINYFFSCLSISAPKEHIIVLDSQLIETIQDDISKLEKTLRNKLIGRDLTTLKSLNILVPLNVDSSHWILACIETFKGYVALYDSLGGTYLRKNHEGFMNEIMDSMDNIMMHTSNQDWTITSTLDVEIMNGLPTQSNGYDCGMYTCLFAKLVYFEEKMEFGAKFISALRTFLHDHIRDSQHYFITFEEDIWANQTNREGLVDYGK